MEFWPKKPATEKAETTSPATQSFGSSDPEAVFELPPEPGVEIPSPGPGESAGEPSGDPGGGISRDLFFANFRGLFAAPNFALMGRGAEPLKSLEIDPGDQDARRASDYLYDICAEVTWLRWILSPEGEWAKRVIFIGGFAYARVNMIRAEVAARRPAVKGVPAPDQAPDQAPDAPPPAREPSELPPEDMADLAG